MDHEVVAVDEAEQERDGVQAQNEIRVIERKASALVPFCRVAHRRANQPHDYDVILASNCRGCDVRLKGNAGQREEGILDEEGQWRDAEEYLQGKTAEILENNFCHFPHPIITEPSFCHGREVLPVESVCACKSNDGEDLRFDEGNPAVKEAAKPAGKCVSDGGEWTENEGEPTQDVHDQQNHMPKIPGLEDKPCHNSLKRSSKDIDDDSADVHGADASDKRYDIHRACAATTRRFFLDVPEVQE